MKKNLIFAALILAIAGFALGCNSSASRCFTKNGSRVPSQTYNNAAPATVPAPVYPVENVIYSSPASNTCNPCEPNACDPCNSGRTTSGYPGGTVLPGLQQ
ncbi:MAG: hypothetical protein Q4G69_07060 [Planctomycetia bacterium]|nr:hypothetical protein [Planctomycetia bacterium]